MVVLNDRLLDLAGGLRARLQDGDKLAIVPALAGGNGAAG
jgi:molybdopterin converting factor small subunit